MSNLTQKSSFSKCLAIIFSIGLIATYLLTLVNLGESILVEHLFKIVMAFIAILLISIFFTAKNNSVISPVGFFIISSTIFILSRLYLRLFTEYETIEIGERIDEENILKTAAFIGYSLALIAMAYLLTPAQVFNLSEFSHLELRIKPALSNPILILGICLLILFLYKSLYGFNYLKTESYESAFQDSQFHSHMPLFFIGKQLILIWLLIRPGKNNFLIATSILFCGAIGFILIGLRGYTIAYLFLFLYFLNERFKISFGVLSSLSLILIFVAAKVLEFRVGFSLYDNIFQVIPKTLHQQGASLEVVFGAVNFSEELRNCISYIEYFKGGDFGQCVDRVRGITWDFGGFASSFFAESIYLGILSSTFICLTFGILLKFLDVISFYRKIMLNHNSNCQFIGVILFGSLANLVYFARSSAFDFILKVLLITFICWLITKWLKSHNRQKNLFNI